MSRRHQFEIEFDELPEDDDGVPIIEFGGETYHLPYYNLLDQTVDPVSLADSIEEEGMQYPIIVDEDNNVIDGMTRLFIAHRLELDPDEVEFEETSVDEDSKKESGWWKAIELNANRRQLTPGMRRKLIQEVADRAGWTALRRHVGDFATMFGVSKAQISRDIDRIEGGETEELKKRKRSVNQQLTGIRSLADRFDDNDLKINVEEDVREEYQQTLNELEQLLEQEREAIDEELEGEENS